MKRISLCIIASVALAFVLGWAGAGTASAAVGDQLISNPSAEGTTSPDGWNSAYWSDDSITASLTWSSDAHSGSHSLRADITAYGTDGDAKWWPNPISVRGNTYYLLSDWYKSNIPTAVSVEYWTSGQDTSQDGTWVNLNSDIAASPDTWTQFQTGFTMPANAAYAIFTHFIAGVGWLETDDYAMTEQAAPAGFNNPIISLTFDDGSNTFYDGNQCGYNAKTAYCLLNQRGFKATTYIPTSLIGTSGYMTTDQLSTIAKGGDEIASHSVSHSDLTKISSDSALASEFTTSKATLEAISGVGSGAVTDFAYPFGTYDSGVVNAEQSAGYVAGRSVEAGYNAKTNVQAYDIRVQNVTPDVTLAQFESWIDYAKAHDYWLVIVYHRVMPSPGNGTLPRCTGSASSNCLGGYDATSDGLSSQLQYINSQGLSGDVKTVKAALQTIASTTPPSTGAVSLTPVNPATNSTVTATPSGFYSINRGTLTPTYSWQLNGATITGATGSTLNLSQAARAKPGDTITVQVSEKDSSNGLTSGTAGATVTVANTPPAKGSVVLAPSAPKARDTVTATASGFSDIDGDALTYQYTWSVNGTVVQGATSQSFPLTSAVGGNTVSVEVRAADGHGGLSDPATASVTVANTAPVAGTLTITPAAPVAGATVTATPAGFTDVDGDGLTYHYQWSLNGKSIDGATDKTYSLTGPVHNDVIAVEVTADDGHGGASGPATASATLVNAAPVAGTVAITPATPKAGATLTATPAGFTDADGDALTYHYQWSLNGQDITGATDITLANSGALRGDVVGVRVWADDGHGGLSGTATTSATFADTAPVKGTVTISPSAPVAGATVTATPAGFTDVDNDALDYHYQWSLNDKPINGATAATYTLTGAVHNDTISVEVTADDGHGGLSDPASAIATLADTPPVTGSVTISPSAPRAGDPLTATPSSFSDVDGETLTYHYQWSLNGKDITGATAATLQNAGAVGEDVVGVTVWADDGSPGGLSDKATSSVTLVNTAPVMGQVTINPQAAHPGIPLTATATATDADNDSLTYHYQWSLNGKDIIGETSQTLDHSAGVTGDEIEVTVWAEDGHGGQTAPATARITLGNNPPLAGSVAITPSVPRIGGTLTATPTGFSDPDGDRLTYHYQWSLNGQDIDGATSATLENSGAARGDVVGVSVWADDGNNGESDKATDTVTIANTAPAKGFVMISPASPQAGTALTATPSGYSDADADQLSYQYAWFLNGQQIAGATGPTLPAVAVLAGQIRVDVRATDGHGGTTDTASDSVTVRSPTVPDTTAPTIRVSSPTAGSYEFGQQLAVSFSCTDSSGIAGCTATLGRTGAQPSTVVSGQKVRLSGTGHYVLHVSSVDVAGNAGSTVVQFTVIDTVAPRIVVTSPKAKTYRLGERLPVKLSCIDAAGIAACKATLGRVGSKPARVASGKAVRLSKTGRYVLRITATDRSGNLANKALHFTVAEH